MSQKMNNLAKETLNNLVDLKNYKLKDNLKARELFVIDPYYNY
jgi:hypothetical protein